LCALHGFHVELEGALPHRPAVLVANHVSYIDPIVIGSLVSLAPIAKAELRRWPIVGTFAGNYGVNFVRRGDTVSEALTLRRALRTLVSGVSVLNFPEGTTSVNRVLPFRRGIFGIARHAGVSVVPIALVPRDPALAWVGSASFLPHYTRTVFSGPHHFRMTVGAPMSPSDYESPAQMAEAARAWIREQVES
jgi:1-acyl-sn-glycerol-3-phosphate acyltransferase